MLGTPSPSLIFNLLHRLQGTCSILIIEAMGGPKEGLRTILVISDAEQAAIVPVTSPCQISQQVRPCASIGAPHKAEA